MEEGKFRQGFGAGGKHGIFLNDFTFEIDLFKAGAGSELAEAVKSLTSNKKMHKRFEALADDPDSLDPKQFLKDINSLGKGRVAQRVAEIFAANDAKSVRLT